MEIKIPDEFKSFMRSTFGAEESDALIEGLQGPPGPGSVRVNPAKKCEMPYFMKNATPVEWCENGYRLDPEIERPNFTMTPQLHAGEYYVQEPASMYVENIISRITLPTHPVKVLDLCAAPGGKTTAALSALPPGSLMVANEFDPLRANVLKENLEKWGTPNVIVTQGPVHRIADSSVMFDIVIADVPCSGEGMMRKDPTARSQWTPGLVRKCAELQREIVKSGAAALREGGFMIYSTCTFNQVENEKNVEWLSSVHGFEIVESKRFAPHTTNSEGLFICLLQKKSYGLKFMMRGHSNFRGTVKDLSNRQIPWLKIESEHGELCYRQTKGEITAIRRRYAPIAVRLASYTKVIMAGIEVGVVKSKGVVPHHGVAMSQLLVHDCFPSIDLNYINAISYLSRSILNIELPPQKGIMLVKYAGLPLGFINNLVTRFNNLYPQQYRIRTGKF